LLEHDMQMMKIAATCGVVFAILDAIWLGFVMNPFYRSQLAPIVRLSADGAIAPNWPAAFFVYVLLGIGIATFVMPHAASVASAAMYGALFGLVVYGVYDLTNYSTLAQYPLAVTIVDMCWGGFATMVCAITTRALVLIRP
jgi:uncharacterized membrane protein